MDDIVKRLRDRAGRYDEYSWHEEIELEAANEIERLREELDKVTSDSQIIYLAHDRLSYLQSEINMTLRKLLDSDRLCTQP